MFESIPANFFVLVVAIGIFITIYILVTKQKPVDAHAHLLSQSQENLTGVAAFMLSGASVSLSIAFALILAFNPIMSLVFVIMFAGFALIEFIAAFHLAKNWNQGRIGGVMFSLFMLIGGISISILAGQSVLHIAEEKAAKEAMVKSAEYDRFLARQQAANDEVKRIAIAPALVTTAKSNFVRLEGELGGLNNKLITLQAKLDNCPRNYFKNCINPTQGQIDRTNQKMTQVQGKFAKAQAIISQNNDFLAAKSIANELNAKSFSEEFDSNANKGIDALAVVLEASSEVVSAYAFLYLAIFCELSAIIAFYLWGQSRYERVLMMGNGRIFDTHSVWSEPQNLMKTRQNTTTDNTHSVRTEPPQPIKTPQEDTTKSTHNVQDLDFLNLVFAVVKNDVSLGNLKNPSFKNLQRKYHVTQAQAGKIRNMLLKEKVCVSDKNNQLVPVR